MVLARKKQAASKKPRGAGAQKKAGRGTVTLNEAADKALKEHSAEIAKSLLNGTIKGNMTAAKLLIALADGQIDCEDEATVRQYCSLAEQLAQEQKWEGE